MTEETSSSQGGAAPPPVPPTPTPPVPPTPPVRPPDEPPSWAAPGAPEPEPPKGSGHGGVTAGIVLILLGVVLLVSRFIPGIEIWELWPFFIIVPGVVQCFTPDKDGWTVYRFFDGLVTIAIGVLFLGNTTGYLSWSVWWELLRLWPVLLISAGLGILGKATSQGWIRVLGTVVVLLAFAYAAMTSFTGSSVSFFSAPGGAEFGFSQPLGLTNDANFRIESGVGEIFVDDIDGSQVEVTGTSPFGKPQFGMSKSGGVADVWFKLTDTDSFVLYPGAPSARVNASLGNAVPWDITFDTGVSSLDADLSDLPVNSVELKTGVSSSTVKLGDAPDTTDEGRMLVSAGVSTVKILVPEDAEVRIESDSGLTGHSISGDFESLGGREWETPGFSAAQQSGDPVWVITVKSGLGSITVDTY